MDGDGSPVAGINSWWPLLRVTVRSARFSKLADTFGMAGLLAEKLGDLDDVIHEMFAAPGPVIADIRVAKEENCFPTSHSAVHNEMLLGPEDQAEKPISEEGMVLA